MMNLAVAKKTKGLLPRDGLLNNTKLKAEDFLDNLQIKNKVEKLPHNEPLMPPEEGSLSAEDLLSKLTEILNESNSKTEEIIIALQQNYKLNVESILFSEENKESPVVRALKQEIARNIGLSLEMMPTFLRKFIINERNAKSKYRQSGMVQSDANLTLPEPESGKYVKWADRNKSECWPDKSKYEQWIALKASGKAISTKGKDIPSEFFKLVWGDYVDSGVLFQTNLRGQQHGENPKKSLDKTLFDLLHREYKSRGKPLSDLLPNNSEKSTERLKDNINNQLAA